jgi:hypothetical protein
MAERLGEVADLAAAPGVVLLGEQARSFARPASRSNSVRASSTRPLRASALASQNEHARNCPSSPGRPSSVSAVE